MLSLRTLEAPVTHAVNTSRDEDGLAWSLHADARLRGWRDGVVTREVALDRLVVGFDLGHGRMASWDETTVTLHAWPPRGSTLGAPLSQWVIVGRCVRAICVGPREVEIYAVETHGPPYDRCGHRFRTKAGKPLGPALATAWGEPPPFGAEGVQPQRSLAEETLYDGPDGRIVLHDPHTAPRVVASPRGHGAVTLPIEGARPTGAAFAPRKGGVIDVIVWERDRLWCCKANGTVGATSTSAAISDVYDVAVTESGALVRGHRGLGWLARFS